MCQPSLTVVVGLVAYSSTSLILPGWGLISPASPLQKHRLNFEHSFQTDFGVGIMLNGMGRVAPDLMQSMYNLLRANFHSVSESSCGKKFKHVHCHTIGPDRFFQQFFYQPGDNAISNLYTCIRPQPTLKNFFFFFYKIS